MYFQRQYANIINLTTERSPLASRILELALNRTGKSMQKQTATDNQIEASDSKSPEAMAEQITVTRDNINMISGILKENMDGQVDASLKLPPAEIERTKHLLQKDVAQYNSDIKLLSLLLGKPVSADDISKLASTNLGNPSVRSVPLSTLPSTTSQTTTVKLRTTAVPKATSFVPPFKPLTNEETQFLQALEQIQTTRPPTTSTSTTTMNKVKTTSKSQEAIIAALLRQQGIGPNSQLPLDVRVF